MASVCVRKCAATITCRSSTGTARPRTSSSSATSTTRLVLLDIGLPQIDGYEVARRVRADPALKDVKLVATTGYGNEKDLQLAREAGFDAHLIKPIDFADVEKLLRQWNQPVRG